jgi:transcriptional regulator of acetoin/glycerol metabolism
MLSQEQNDALSEDGIFEPRPVDSYAPLEPEIANPTVEEKVRREILAACQGANWKLGGPRGAAARLGLKRTTLFYKMKRLGIRPPADY